MDRPARHLLILTLLASCGGDPTDPALDLIEPSGTVELLPDGEVELAWTVSGEGAELLLALRPVALDDTEYPIYDEPVDAGPGSFVWTGNHVEGWQILPDVYDLEATLFVDGDPVDSTVRNVSVHGVFFTSPGPLSTMDIEGSALPVDIRYRTVSQRVIHLRTWLDPTAGGDAIQIDDRTIPGEFVPFTRDIAFTGLDVDGGAIPEGMYTVYVDVTDDDDPSLAYRSGGGLVRWLPDA